MCGTPCRPKQTPDKQSSFWVQKGLHCLKGSSAYSGMENCFTKKAVPANITLCARVSEHAEWHVAGVQHSAGGVAAATMVPVAAGTGSKRVRLSVSVAIAISPAFTCRFIVRCQAHMLFQQISHSYHWPFHFALQALPCLSPVRPACQHLSCVAVS